MAQNVHASGQPDCDETQTVAPVAVAHRDRLDREAVGGAQPQLDRAVGGVLHLVGGQLAQRHRRREPRAQVERQRRELVVALGEPRVAPS